MRLALRTKLMAIVGVTAAAFVLIIAAGALIVKGVEAQVGTIQARYLPKLELEPQLDGVFERLRRGFQEAVAAHDIDALAATAEAKESFIERLTAARGVVDSAEAAALRGALEDYYASAYDVSRRIIAGETGEPLGAALGAAQRKERQFTEVLKRTMAFDRRQLAGAFAAVNRAETTALIYRVMISIGCFIAVMLLSIWLGRGVLRSVAALTSGLRRFGSGDFGQAIQVASGDELWDVAQHANQMASSLKRSARERLKAEEKFRGLLEAAPDAMVIVDKAGRIVLVNAEAERLFGYARHELLDRGVEMLVPERFRSKHGLHRAAYFSAPKVRKVDPRTELYGLRKDGVEFPAEIRLAHLDTEEGALVSSAVRDITARKATELALKVANRDLEAFGHSITLEARKEQAGRERAEQALRQNEEEVRQALKVEALRFEEERAKLDREKDRLRGELEQTAERAKLLIDGVRDYALFTLDPDGNVTSWNTGAERITGYREDEIIGKHFSIFYEKSYVKAGGPELELKRAADTGRCEQEGLRVRKGGSSFWAGVIITSLRSPDGRLRGFAKITRDITKRKEADLALGAFMGRLQRSNEELQEFAMIASHDLQEPLRKVQMFGDRLKQEFAETLGPTGEDYINRMQGAASRGQTLIQGLLAYSRVTTKAQLPVLVDLRVVATEVVGDLEGHMAQVGGTIDIGSLPSIEADPLQMRQLIQNLLGNALKFHRPDVSPAVRISATPIDVQGAPAGWQIAVADNGIGFDEKYLDRIFKLFQRLHERGVYEGAGMGLAISRKIVERHQGMITARSTPGQGTTMLVTLPTRQREVEKSA